MQLYRTLQQIIKPYQYVRPNEKQRHLSKKEKAVINEHISIMEVNSVLDELEEGVVDIVESPESLVNEDKLLKQYGGFIRRIEKEEEMDKLEPNVKRFEKEDDNIMMALAIGNFVNISSLSNGKGQGGKNMYVSCFATKKTPCRIDMDSFVRGNPQIVLFEEIFMSSEDARVLKLNMVNILPNNVWERIKSEYGKYIKFCV